MPGPSEHSAPTSATQAPLSVYATLAGTVNDEMSKRVFAKTASLVAVKATTVHLLIQSLGGFVGDGVGIYNFLRKLPVELITYNGGQIASAAVLIYLAGQVRKVSQTATFALHRSHLSTTNMTTAEHLKLRAQNVKLDDARVEAIWREHLKLPPKKRQIAERGDLMLSAQEGVKFGLATELGDFAVPFGAPLINVMTD